jgi:hypothetical protein
MPESPGRGALVTAASIFAVLLAAANALGYVLYAQSLADPAFTLAGAGFTARLSHAFSTMYAQHPGYFWYFLLLPLVVVGFLAFLVSLRSEALAAPAAAVRPVAEKPAPPPGAGGLHLLALLQQEGRFVDFIEENIDGYSDADIGAGVRAIHSGCRNALHERMTISRIYAEDDGATVEVDRDYDPALVRLTGNVHGAPPFRGRLEHGGWRASDVRLPERVGDPTILTPAEIEIS